MFELGPNWYTSDVVEHRQSHPATLDVVDADGRRSPTALSVGPAFVGLRHDDQGRGPRYGRAGANLVG